MKIKLKAKLVEYFGKANDDGLYMPEEWTNLSHTEK